MSKLASAKDSGSELQLRDVRTLLDDSMSDTPPEFEAMVNERYRRMSPDERVRITRRRAFSERSSGATAA